LRGQGTAKDEARAVAWFQKAADNGHAFAQYELAEAHRLGRGVAQDNKEALRWYRNAAKKGPEGLVDDSMIEELAESVKADKKTAE
jgi:TPR repeat protein